jgi:phospholipase C
MDTKHLMAVALALTTAVVACSAQSDEGDGAGGEDVGATEGKWDAESVDNEHASTHLWIVNRGIDLLGKHPELPVAKSAFAFMNEPNCRTNWQQGLIDADFKAVYNNGRHDLAQGANDAQVALSGATWESHFFDVDTGKNYKGATSPTALTEAETHIKRSMEDGAGRLASGNAKACYELGLALHYYTDMTQPMHAVNFTATMHPAKLHSNLEGYAMEIQARYPLDEWSGAPSGEMHDYILKTARDSKALWEPGVKAVVGAYNKRQWDHGAMCRVLDANPLRFIARQHIDYRVCWEGDPDVDAAIGTTLTSAQDHTAKFIYLVAAKALGAAEPPTEGPPSE